MSATSATSGGDPRAPRDLFGHPRALPFLFATEMWERFSYYGMRSLLVLYMVKYLLAPQHAGAVIGLAGLPWFQAFNPFMIFAFTPFVVALWRWQGQREPTARCARRCPTIPAAARHIARRASGRRSPSW